MQRGRGDTGWSVGEQNDRHKGWEGLERRQGVAQREGDTGGSVGERNDRHKRGEGTREKTGV